MPGCGPTPGTGSSRRRRTPPPAAGGFRYSATTSMQFLLEARIVEILNVSTLHGLSRDPARSATVSLPIPNRWPTTASSNASSCRPALLLCHPHHLGNGPRGETAFRPRPGATTPTPATPLSAEAFPPEPHLVRIGPATAARSPRWRAHRTHSNALACTTFRCDNDVEAAIRSNSGPRSPEYWRATPAERVPSSRTRSRRESTHRTDPQDKRPRNRVRRRGPASGSQSAVTRAVAASRPAEPITRAFGQGPRILSAPLPESNPCTYSTACLRGLGPGETGCPPTGG